MEGGVEVCRDADKTSLKRDDQHRKKPYGFPPSQFPAKLVYFWPGQNICGVTRHFHAFFAPLGYFYCLSPHNTQHLAAKMGKHSLTLLRRVDGGNALFIIGVRSYWFPMHTADSRSGFLCLAEFTQPCANWRKSARAFHPAALLLDVVYFLFICCFREFL